MEKAREFQENIHFFIDYAKAFDCVDHNKLWKILKETAVSDHLTCPKRNLDAGQEAMVRAREGTNEFPNWERSTTLYIVILLACLLSHFISVWLFVTLWTVAHQAPLSMGFSRQEDWTAMPSSRGSSRPKDWNCLSYVSCICKQIL